MHESSHFRAASLALALFVVVAAWLSFEYSNSPPLPLTTSASEVLTATRTTGAAPSQVAASPNQAPDNLNITYKCEKSGRISFGDRPCAANEKALAVSTTEKAPIAKNNLEQLRERSAAWDALKTKSGQQSPASDAKPVTSANIQSNELRCQQIDRAIVIKDSELRQPHSAQWGDYLTAERKKLYDERFSLNC